MGYRSDVAYVIKFNTIEGRDAFVSLMLAKNEDLLTQAINETTHDGADDPIITFKADNVKWYNHYSDVAVHHNLLNAAHDLYEARYRLVAIGEDGAEECLQQDDEYELDNYVSSVHQLVTNF